jgi:hypothetical protein
MHVPIVQVFPMALGQQGCPVWPQGVQVESKEQSSAQIATPLGTCDVVHAITSFGAHVEVASNVETQYLASQLDHPMQCGGAARQSVFVVQGYLLGRLRPTGAVPPAPPGPVLVAPPAPLPLLPLIPLLPPAGVPMGASDPQPALSTGMNKLDRRRQSPVTR